jgi:catechol 2,3-dioxygenase-like lactoylglutathione lyase family enzyme
MAGVEAIAFVIHTKRFDESVEFYCGVLGLELVEEWTEGGHGAVIRLTSGADLELIELDEVERHAGVALGLEVADVDAWYARILAQGGTAKAPPVGAFGKRGFGTTDPNNVAVNVYTTER